MPMMSMATSSDTCIFALVFAMALVLAFVAGRQALLQIHGITRYGETEEKEYGGRAEIAGRRGYRGDPFLIGESGLNDAQQIEEADDRHKRRVLEKADEGIDDVGDDDTQRLRQNDQSHDLPIGQAQGVGRLVLAFRNGLKAAAHDLGHVSGGEQGDADQRPQQLVEIDAARQEKRQHDRGHEQDGDQRHAADHFDEGDREKPYGGHLGAAAKGQKNSDGQRRDDTGNGDDQRDQKAAPLRGFDHRQSARQTENRDQYADAGGNNEALDERASPIEAPLGSAPGDEA